MNSSLLFLLILGGLAAAGAGGGGGDASTTTIGGADVPDDDAPSVPETPAAPSIVTPAPVADTPTAPDTPSAPNVPSAPNTPPSAPNTPEPSPLPDSAYDIGWDGLTAEEQMLVELVNRARLDPLGELARQDDGFAAGVSTAPKEALAVVPTLSDASRGHSEDMDNRDFFAHTNLDGESPSDRAIEAGHGSRFTGENIGWIGSSRTSFDAQARVEDHHDNLWESDGHQQNFMSNNWSEIGTGYDYGDYLGYAGSTFATEMFGDRGETYLTGVVIEDDDGDEFYDIGEGQGGVNITAYSGDDVFATATWDSGGYSLALPAGQYRVVFEGGDLDMPYETNVTIGSENVKLDVIDEGGSVAASLSASAVPDPALLPEIPVVDDTLAFVEDDEEDMELMLF